MDRSTWPHVTAVLKSAGLTNVQWATEYDRDRGTAVHLATSYLDQGRLDFSSLAPDIAVRVEQYQQFLIDVKPEILAIEQEVYHDQLRYQGRLDRVMLINGRHGVLDLKGTCQDLSHGPQLSAYLQAFREMNDEGSAHWTERVFARWNLYLFDDHYKLIEQKDPSDWRIFQAALSIHNWRQSHE